MLTDEEQRRYRRNLTLPGIGEAGQQALLEAHVLVVGCGALGSISSMYLAASGVGHITLIDFDRIDISNLQRQLSFSTASVGEKKVIAAATRLREINPGIEIVPLDLRLTEENAPAIFASQNLIIDGTDNPATKYLIARIATSLGKPYIFGGVHEWRGQVMSCLPESPGYTDLFPEPAADATLPPGLLGPLPGIVASSQAAEAIKILTGAGTPLASRLLLIDAFEGTTKVIHL